MDNPDSPQLARRRRVIIVILFLSAAGLGLYLSGIFSNGDDKPVAVSRIDGDRFAGFDDLYHAQDGLWRLETKVYLLRERKFVSSRRELQDYLVYEATPGEIVRLKESAGRWKLLEVLEEEKVKAVGWADVDKNRGERLSGGNQTSLKPDA